jgi:hypothetical protein
MGTRSLTHIKEEGRTIVTIYRQFDGYLSGMGADIANFCESGEVVNGFWRSNQKQFNGIGCFAAQFICSIKDGVGNVYIMEPNISDVGEEYVYTVEYNNNEFNINCFDVWNKKTVYDGPPSALLMIAG